MQVSVKRNKSIDTTRHHKKFKKNDSKGDITLRFLQFILKIII